MQYLIVAHDGTDSEAETRRMAARPAHVALGYEMKALGQLLYGVAILDDNEKMIGSVLICNFDSKAELEAWLKKEPYLSSKVWEKIDIQPCRVGPAFCNWQSFAC